MSEWDQEDAVSEYQLQQETMRRLRDLHGVFEMALLLASEALEESHPELTARQWFETLMKEAVRKIDDETQFGGRWSLFTREEIQALTYAFGPEAGGTPSAEFVALAAEIDFVRGRWPDGVDGRNADEPEVVEVVDD